MARRRHYRRRRKHRRRVSESIAVYSSYHDLAITTSPNAAATTLDTQALPKIINEGTTNRKIVRVRGIGSISSSVAQGSVALMICMRCVPELQGSTGFPGVPEFDPFNAGPATPGSTTYEGRPSPRPFARHTVVLANDGSSANTLYHDFNINSRAQRLIRPGWELHLGVYASSVKASQSVRLGMLLNVTVEG